MSSLVVVIVCLCRPSCRLFNIRWEIYIYIVDNKEACGPDVRPVERPWTDFSIIRDLHRGLLYCDAGTTLMGNVLHDSRQ